jgi:succinyl-CoA synthetase beta subunit
LAILLDRSYNGPVIVASSQGGVDIEKVAHESPESIIQVPVDIDTGITIEHSRKISNALGFTETKLPQVHTQLQLLYKLFIEKDCLLAEINPFVESSDGEGNIYLLFICYLIIHFNIK